VDDEASLAEGMPTVVVKSGLSVIDLVVDAAGLLDSSTERADEGRDSVAGADDGSWLGCGIEVGSPTEAVEAEDGKVLDNADEGTSGSTTVVDLSPIGS
jgi:hypothetical protein